jgi:phage portal protein BeeE
MALAERMGQMITRARGAAPSRRPPTQQIGAGAGAGIVPYHGLVGHGDTELYRRLARRNPWVRSAVNIRNNQIATAEWEILPRDPKKPHSVRLQKQITELFETPNSDDGFDSFMMQVNEDLLVLDAGCFEKDRSLDGVIRQLWPVNAGEVRVNLLWDGDPRDTRFYWYPDHQPHWAWRDRDFVHQRLNPNTQLPTGIAPLETLFMVMEAILTADEYQLRNLRGAAPDGMLDLGEGVNANQVMDFTRFWMADVAGKGAMAIVGGSKGSKFIPFRTNNRDMQYAEYQVFLVRMIAACFGLSPQDLGLTMDINRANAEQQATSTDDKGHKPMLSTVQSYLTRKVVWDPGFGGRDNNLRFAFKALNLKETLQRAEINQKALADVPWKLVDEARIDDGRPPLGGKLGEMLLMSVANGVVLIDPNDIPTAREYLDMQNKQQQTTGEEPGERPEPAAAAPAARTQED